MGETLIIQNIELYKAFLMDKFILASIFFGLLMLSAFTRSIAVKKVSYQEMICLSLFFAVLLALYAPKIMSVIGNNIFGLPFMIGLAEKEILLLIKRYTINRVYAWLNKDLKDKGSSKNMDDDIFKDDENKQQ